MLSSHYPLAFGSELNWAIAPLVFLLGVSIRHYFNTYHATKKKLYWTWIITFIIFAVIIGLSSYKKNSLSLSENVIDGRTGWVVPKREPELLAKQIKEVLNYDYSIKKDIQEQAQNRVKKYFNLIEQKRAFFKFFN